MKIRNLNKNNLNFKSISNTNGKTINFITDNYNEIGEENHKIIYISSFFQDLYRFTYTKGTLINNDIIFVDGYIFDLWDNYSNEVEKTIKNTSRILS